MVLLGRYQIEAWFRNCWWTTWTVHANDISMLWFCVCSSFLSLFFAPLICIRTCWWSDANWNSTRNRAITCNTKLCLIWLHHTIISIQNFITQFFFYDQNWILQHKIMPDGLPYKKFNLEFYYSALKNIINKVFLKNNNKSN